MRVIVLFLAIIAAVSAQFSNSQYNPFNPYNRNTYNRNPYNRDPYNRDPYNAETLNVENDSGPDGSFNYFFETSNGIAAQEQGVPRDLGGNPPVVPVVVQGSFSWTSPEGKPIAIAYVADENGYRATGDAIPTPPPLPAQIARALARTIGLQK